jgi:hypothetical protein
MSLPGPDARVVELRVPGLIGITGEQLLDCVATVTVAGDDSADVVRPADRLRRPVPGPVLQALGRSLPRTLEGYLWGKMTSGGAAKATWAVLFPFSLANVAHGMLPVPAGRAGHALLAVCQAMLRIVGLLLTALLVTQLGVISLDLLAAQCLAPGSSCLRWTPDWLRDSEGVRVVVGLLPPVLVVAALHQVSVVSWKHAGVRITAASTTIGARAARGGGRLAGDILQPNPNAGVLRGLHTITSLVCIALLPVGGPFSPPAGGAATVVWLACVVALVLAVVLTAALDDVAVWLSRVFPPGVRAVLITAAAVLVVLAGVVGSPLASANRAGVDLMAEGFLGVMLLAWVAFAVLLAPLAWLSRGSWRGLPRRLRPWLGGWAAAPTALLACLIGAGFGAGLSIALRELIGDWDIDLPVSYTSILLLWGAAAIVIALLWAGFYLVAIPLRRRRRGVPLIVRMLQRGREEQREAASAWATAIIERKHLHRVVAAAALLLGVGALLLAVRRVLGWPLPPALDLDGLAGFGVLALGLLAAGLLRVVYTAARTPERSRHLGALADLVYFWPRRAHPIVPPSYALKVVPDLVDRAAEHLREPNTRVVLAGYSHGGLLALIAAARLADTVTAEQSERIGLLTAGTPAQWGYQRAFPGLLQPEQLAALYGRLEGRWRGMCRGTDPFGGGVTTWRHQVVGGKLLGVGYTSDGTIGPLPPAVPGVAGALVIGGDHWLPDPVARQSNGHRAVDRRWAPGVLAHTDYLVDPEWDRAVAIAAGLERPESAALRNGSEQPPLFDTLPRLP